MTEPPRLDLPAYLARIGYAGPREVSAATLAALHESHLGSIPFENLDVRLGRPVSLELGALEAKLVHGGRGGYCFEQNSLFAAALRALGFTVTTLEARVRTPGSAGPRPRTHMVLRVDIEGNSLLADVGFGGDGPRRPVPIDGTVSQQGDSDYQVEPEGDGVYALRRGWQGVWSDLYSFSHAPALPVDYEVAHHYTAGHPRSPFVRALTVQLTAPAARHILRGRTYVVRRAGEEITREVPEAEVPGLLRSVFGLRVPAEDVRRALEPPTGAALAPSSPAIAESLAALGRDLYARGWAVGTSGNYSAVAGRDPLRLAISKSGRDKATLRAQDILEIDERGNPVEGAGRPSAETAIHLAVVGTKGAGAVIHTHSVWSTLLSELRAADGGLWLDGYEVLAGLAGVLTHEHREWVPIIDNTRDWNARREALEEMLRRHPGMHAFLIRGHGLYTWGEDLQAAKRHVEIFEFLFELVARMPGTASRETARAR